MVLSGALIAVNWLVFIYAVSSDRVSHTSLGYYVNPLVSVALGFFVLREGLRPAQWFAVGVASAGVVWWTLQLGGLPWIAAALAGSFALYGLVRKLVPLPSLVGFALEMLYLAPLAATYLASRPTLALADAGASLHAWVAVSGIVTAAPLVCFASAARRLPLAVLGIFQYIAPSLALLLAVAVYGEAFTHHHAVSFGCVALALSIFSLDSFRAGRHPARALA
jgi:chloramphenicol-sensitive protein RarD